MVNNSVAGIESLRTLHVILFTISALRGGVDSPTFLIREVLL